MSTPHGLQDLLDTHIARGSAPGAVALVARDDRDVRGARDDRGVQGAQGDQGHRGHRVEVAVAGSATLGGSTPMRRNSVFRLASITKPIVAAAAMTLVEDGVIAPADPVAAWLPELASPLVVRTPQSPVDDVVSAVRPITVLDLLTFRAGYGFPSDFSLPAVAPLFAELKQGPPRPQAVPGPDAWMAALSRIPLLHQPGDGWLYNTCSDILGVLVARAADRPLPAYLAERLFEPLGMTDTGFSVAPGALDRFTGYYRAGDGSSESGPELVDAPDGQWSRPPAFPSGAGGLVSTVDDWYAFGRMLLAGGLADDGRRVLSAESVRQMVTDHLTPAQRAESGLFTEGQGWGFGGSVDVEITAPWNVPGRYGWVGGTGTTAHIVPSTSTVAVLLTQMELAGPAAPQLMRDFWTYAARF
ncbi:MULTISPECIES: serine hydrolase [Streptomyces]|uniref:serine hydrolase domain-containing protein n=1 Tax=Streptomyces TaxID=1883 RepID=UPI00103D2C0C|nr:MULTISPECIES: serine hydrolase domain-containing protein [Streptomyces]MBT3076852.1 beta-lactamase family protein [Streptomyces sp. COG21]MBT3082169.1 beta-lactamase family protein [Streptomyces sp. COG20]MBT3090529.1 beta-lactamase family protein [Streptomyces sp. CYG21]MBT3098915.1 beta-lactamase family protein [Streptomyces sp. CBG30]MBT3104138.1 beta-lactamase family protein [Streptomyces sp. COG19]